VRRGFLMSTGIPSFICCGRTPRFLPRQLPTQQCVSLCSRAAAIAAALEALDGAMLTIARSLNEAQK
jgi:hypothetical protein